MFDPTKYSHPKVRHLPVILLLDVSGSMQGEKIDNLYDAVNTMIGDFVNQASNELMIDVAIFTFGGKVELHTKYTPVADLKAAGLNRFTADGNTPLGLCLTQAKDYIEDKEETSGSNYAPTVVLVSDGMPNDEYENPMREFIGTGRSQKAQRLAISIGSDAKRDMLESFTGDPNLVFFAESAGDIADSFKKVTMSVSMRSHSTASTGSSDNGSSSVRVTRITSKSSSSSNGDDDDLDF